MRYSIAIDPGVRGAISMINEHFELQAVLPMPTVSGKVIDDVAALNLVRKLIPETYEHLFLSFEDIEFIALGSKANNFTYGASRKSAEFICKIIALQYDKISLHAPSPKVWQASMWISADKTLETRKKGKNTHDPKAVSFNAIRRLYPKHEWKKSKDGLYDATLIAHATMKEYTKTENIEFYKLPF